jgi:hypothetical protein
MGSVKVAILEKDGVEYDFPVEMDLIAALSFVGFTGGSFNENLILTNNFFEVICDQFGNVLLGV